MAKTNPQGGADPVLFSHSGSKSQLPPRNKAFDATELLARLWQQNLPLMRDRVAYLEATSQEAQAGVLSEARRTEAKNIAHKLAGSLGMFGYPQGTEIARELEMLLEAEGAPEPASLLRLSGELRLSLPL